MKSFGKSKTVTMTIPNKKFVKALQEIAEESELSLDLLLLQELDKSELFKKAREKMQNIIK